MDEHHEQYMRELYICAYLGKALGFQNSRGFNSLFGVVLPFDVAVPPLPFFGEIGRWSLRAGLN